ncbi:Exosome complex component rrp4, partial [Teratosphaeria destructans]
RRAGVVRAKRQIFTLQTARGGELDVILGVNGYVWISAHGGEVAGGQEVGVNRLEEVASAGVYSSVNAVVAGETRREIARVAGCVRALREGGVRVDEERVRRAYEVLVELEEGEDAGGEWVGGERGRRVVEVVLAGG